MTALAFLAFGLALAGFAALSATMARHQRDIFRVAPGSRATAALRWAGRTSLTASLLAAMAAWNPVVGLAGWVGTLSMAAVAIVLLLTYRPRALPIATVTAMLLPLIPLAIDAVS